MTVTKDDLIDSARAVLASMEKSAATLAERITEKRHEIGVMVALKFQVTLGSTVVRFRGRHYLARSVRGVLTGSNERPWLQGALIRKDGRVGSVTHDLYYEWKVDPRATQALHERDSRCR